MSPRLRRAILGLVLFFALMGMHGIGVSTASAATPCGSTIEHTHAIPPESSSELSLNTDESGGSGHSIGHVGAACLAILLTALLIGSTVSRRSMKRLASSLTTLSGSLYRETRGPPTLSPLLLCVSRT